LGNFGSSFANKLDAVAAHARLQQAVGPRRTLLRRVMEDRIAAPNIDDHRMLALHVVA
jgi:hypothetical protein